MGRFEIRRGNESMFYRGRGAKALFEKHVVSFQPTTVVDTTSHVIGFAVEQKEEDDGTE